MLKKNVIYTGLTTRTHAGGSFLPYQVVPARSERCISRCVFKFFLSRVVLAGVHPGYSSVSTIRCWAQTRVSMRCRHHPSLSKRRRSTVTPSFSWTCLLHSEFWQPPCCFALARTGRNCSVLLCGGCHHRVKVRCAGLLGQRGESGLHSHQNCWVWTCSPHDTVG